MKNWHLTSWQQKPVTQSVAYPDKDKLNLIVQQLSQLPPLVTRMEVDKLKQNLSLASQGKAFVLQGGDCAESFANCNANAIMNKLKILLQMSLVLIHGLERPVIRVGRIAGQYAKPRSNNQETKDGITLPSYRGDIINQQEFSEKARIPNPELLLKGYQYSALTLNYIRALVDGGFADLQHPEYWNLDFVKHSPLEKEYQILVNAIAQTLSFLKTIAGVQAESLNRVEFYTSHEALQLYYEQALTRQQEDGLYYDLSAHFPWIGMRTADVAGAHVEFLRGIANPIAIKIGPSITKEKLLELIDVLNPRNESGKLTLIMRLGVKHVDNVLPGLIETVNKQKKHVLWSCDPMHGNTEKTTTGYKTRRFDDILSELQQNFAIHAECETHLGGVHFELTGENVTECIGGARGLSEADLHIAYESLVDPRLNYEQSLEMALLIAKHAGIRHF